MASHAPTALELRLSRELRVSRRRVKRVGGAALLPLGVITSLASKLAYEMRTHDAPFHKPLFMTLVSFVAMSLCALPQLWHAFRRDARRRKRRRERARVEASRDARRSREASRASHDHPNLPAASDCGSSLAAPLLANETDADETDAFLSDLDRTDGDAALAERRASGAGRRNANGSGFVSRVASLFPRLAPAAFADVLATALISHAILRLPLSAFLSLRHFQLVFAAVVAVALRRELNPLHKLGVSLSLSGAALAALSVEIFEADAAGRARAAVGVACLFLSQIAQTLTLTFETRAAVADDDVWVVTETDGTARNGAGASPRRSKLPSPSTALGIEGAAGTAFLLLIVMPLAQVLIWLSGFSDGGGGVSEDDATSFRNTMRTIAAAAGEDSFSTARVLFANRNLAALVLCHLFCLALYNHAGASLSRVMGVMSRTKLETTRTLVCWLIAATLECGASSINTGGACFPGEAGMPAKLLLLRFAGFVMGTLGTLLYGRGDAAERQRVFQRDELLYKSAYAPRGGRRRSGRRVAFRRRDGREDESRFRDGFGFRRFDGDDDEEAASSFARPSQTRRLSFSGGFGSPVGAGTGMDDADRILGDDEEALSREEELSREAAAYASESEFYRRGTSDSGFGSGSLRSSMAFSSFGGEAAPRSVARRPARSGTDGPARVVQGFAEDAT